jgi:lipopolysaccharide/colanic/teichoic acid biosynthesis glycosyltransferase
MEWQKDNQGWTMVKRFFDFLLAMIALFLLTPFFVLILVLVLAESGRPPFFQQQRVGRHGKPFTVHKFRTMYPRGKAEDSCFDAGDISRITPFGAFLRRAKLDELPQLFNVACGEMSLVGPRPEVGTWVDIYPDRWAKVHQVRPGLTDPASIVYRNEELLLVNAPDPEAFYRDGILPHKLSLYEEYVDNQSFRKDIKILTETFRALFQLRWKCRNKSQKHLLDVEKEKPKSYAYQ